MLVEFRKPSRVANGFRRVASQEPASTHDMFHMLGKESVDGRQR